MRLILSSLFLLWACTAAAQTVTFSRTDAAAASAPRAIAVADFNRDGWADVATAGTGRDSVGIHLSRGAAGGFTFASDIVVGGGPFEMVVGDLNNDDAPDLAIANADLNTVTILLGKGDGTFLPKKDVPLPGNPRGIALADHNHDGQLDIFVTQFAASSWTILYGDGAGGVSSQANYAAGEQPQGIVARDFNNDGIADVVIANANSGLTVYSSSGPMTWSGRTIASRPGNVLAAGDFNQDGWLDVAVVSTANSTIAIYLGGASGLTFSSEKTTGSSPRGIAAADVNQDGVVDLVTANRGSNTLTLFAGRRDAPGQFAGGVIYPAGTGSRMVAAADFDHDGKIDLASANEFASSVSLLLNTTSLVQAAFSFEMVLPLGPAFGAGSPATTVAFDFDRNGKPDVLTMGEGGLVMLFDGTSRSRKLPTSSNEDFALGDFDGDGNQDIAALSYWTNEFQVFLGDGRGGFEVQPSQPVPQGFFISAADLNHDGRSDVVVKSVDVFHIFYSQGDGTFAAGANVRLPTGSYKFKLADMNRDGWTDIVSAHFNPSGVNIIYGDGAGAWTKSEFYAVANHGIAVEVGDFNEDGRPDIILGADVGLTLFLARAGGGFAASSLAAGPYTFALYVGDMNADGHLDIVQPATDILFGKGDGTFTLMRFHDPQEGGGDLTIADMNLDGLPDIVSGNGFGWFSIIQNERNATNHPPVANAGSDFTVGYDFQFGDGDLELDGWQSSDPDMHELSFEWRLAGEVVSTGQSFSPRFPRPGQYTYTLSVNDNRGAQATDTVTITVTPYKEIVMHAAGFWTLNGAWQRVESDATAADGVRVFHPDAGASKLATPLANPVHYFDVYFAADPTQTYKLWIRGKAQGNSWANDSVFVQFDGAVDANGQTYKPGTTSALTWNLEECSGCGVSGWGWEDDAWGAVNKNGVMLRFADGGWQRMRIQTREDGVSIDQVVLSAEKYIATRPGSAKNDTTILPRTVW